MRIFFYSERLEITWIVSTSWIQFPRPRAIPFIMAMNMRGPRGWLIVDRSGLFDNCGLIFLIFKTLYKIVSISIVQFSLSWPIFHNKRWLYPVSLRRQRLQCLVHCLIVWVAGLRYAVQRWGWVELIRLEGHLEIWSALLLCYFLAVSWWQVWLVAAWNWLDLADIRIVIGQWLCITIAEGWLIISIRH